MEEGLFPSSRSVESLADLEEERRLMYVAITRAKRGVMLTFSEMRRVWGKTENTAPSRFLKEIDAEYIEANFNIEELSGRNRWERVMEENDGFRPRFESLKSRYGGDNERGGERPTASRRGGSFQSRSQRPRPEIIATPQPIDPTRAGMRSVGIRPDVKPEDVMARQAGHAATECEYRIGELVEHPKFGRGTVERIEPLVTDHKVVVNFLNYGSKTLLAKYAKLTKL